MDRILSCTARAALAACLTFLTAAAAPPDIVVGAVFPLTGPEATFGVSAKRGIELVLGKLNQAGGVGGRKIKVKILDDQGKPEEAALATTKLIGQDGAIAIIGEITSSSTLAMAPIAQANRIPLVTPGATHPKVTTIGDYVFRTCFVDAFQGKIMAKFLAENLKAKRVAILKDAKNDYSIGLAQHFREDFARRGGAIVSEQTYLAGDIDFRAQLTELRGAKPDFVYVPGYYTDIGLLARQARELGITAPMGGGDGWDSPKIFEIGGAAVEGSYFSNHYSRESDAPRTRQFVADYRRAFGADPDAIAAITYDAAEVLLQAIQRAKSLSGADLRDAIAATHAHAGVTGSISFDGKQDPVKSGVILRLEKGKQVYVATVKP